MTLIVTIPHKMLDHLRTCLRWTANVLFMVGVMSLGWYFVVFLQARIYGAYEDHRLAAWLAFPQSFGRVPHPTNRGDFIGQLDVPRIGLHAIVLEGADDGILRLGVGHVSGTALPGQAGNVSLAAHRDSFFRPLRFVRKKDEIRLTTYGGRTKYIVDWTRVVSPENIKVLRPTEHSTLTLVTCYPFHYVGSAPDRFIVRAHRVPS